MFKIKRPNGVGEMTMIELIIAKLKSDSEYWEQKAKEEELKKSQEKKNEQED